MNNRLLKVVGTKEYQLVEEEEDDWEGEENRELKCRQGKGRDADAIRLSVVLPVQSPLPHSLNSSLWFRGSSTLATHCGEVGLINNVSLSKYKCSFKRKKNMIISICLREFFF